MDLELQLRQAETRRAELERAHQDAVSALRGCTADILEARQSRVRELEKKVALETVRCEELQLELSAALRNKSAAAAVAAAAAVCSGTGTAPIITSSVCSSSSASAAVAAASSVNNHHHNSHQSWGSSKGSEIERIMAKIEQDNRILAELDHSRSTTLGTGLATSASSHALGESSPPISPITMSHTTPAICYPASSLCAASAATCQPSSLQYLATNSGYSTMSSTYNTYPQSYSKNTTSLLSGLPNMSALGQQGLGASALGAGSLATGGLAGPGGLSSLAGLGPSYSSACPISNTTFSHPLVSNNPTSIAPYSTQSYASQATSALNPTTYSLPYNPVTTFSNNVTFSNPLSAQFSQAAGVQMSAAACAAAAAGAGGPMSIKLKPLDDGELGASRRVATPCTPHPPAWSLGAAIGLSDTRPLSRLMPDGLDSDWGLHAADRAAAAAAQYLNGHSNDGQVDMLDIPGKGRCSVYIARFSYEPEPEANDEELAVAAGDYLLVWGEPAGPGSYLDAELLDGRRGLVPSHFCTRLIGDDLLEFHQAVLSTLRDEEITADAYAADLQRLSEMAELSEGHDDDVNEMETVPAPRQLTLERQLNKSVLIGWTAPETGPGNQIESYHVYVDGVLKTTVKATERTRALVEGVDSNRPHRISVRSVTANRRTSRDAACTMVIGKDTHMLGPTAVRASHVTSSQAVISWLPANSNHQHVVCVNNVEVRTVKPGVYRHTITGLAPNTQYRVTVRAKHLRAHHPAAGPEEPPSPAAAHTDFRTLPKGLPDPPSDIMVEPGPQDGTLLVTWHPVLTMHHPGSSVTGYAVYADGKKVTDVDSPTGDHALIDISKLLGLNPKHVTVRTKSRDSQSADSAPTPIPGSVVRGGAARMRQPHSALPMHVRGAQGRPVAGQQVIEHDENLSDKEIFPSATSHRQGAGAAGTIPAIEITKDTASEANMSEDDYVDGRRRLAHQSPRARQAQAQHYGPGAPMQSQQTSSATRAATRAPRHQAPPAAHKRARWFVALFDYDPATMSPNPDACEEELPFSEGDSIKVWGDKDADGFYWGECRGRRGYVPHNMVMEVEGRDGSHDRWGDIYANMPVKRMIALYDYDPQELSPNVDAEVELSFTTGSIIHVYGDMDDDGFYMGELDGVRGLVPSNFLTEAPDQYGSGGGAQQGQGGSGGGRGGRAGRGHGPGARGPPPPPRDTRATRNKQDACPVVPCSQLDTINSHSTNATVSMPPNTQPFTTEHNQGPQAQGRGRGVAQGVQQNVQRGRGGSNEPMSMAQSTGPMGGTRLQHRGVPAVIPNSNIMPQQQQQQQQQQQSATTSNTGPNLMQKFTEMTAPGGDILSKGKELIFMKFGLGGGK